MLFQQGYAGKEAVKGSSSFCHNLDSGFESGEGQDFLET